MKIKTMAHYYCTSSQYYGYTACPISISMTEPSSRISALATW